MTEVASDVAYEVVDGEAVVLHLGTGRYYRLDRVATVAFEALAETGDLAAARARLLDRFAVAPEVLDRDMAVLVGELSARGLLEMGPAEGL